jgi:hypothetical protein
VEWTFGTVLWSMVVLFFWFAFIWMSISVFGDILRRNTSGWAKAGWIVLILLLPVIGILVYLIARPVSASEAELVFAGRPAAGDGARGSGPADEIARAVQLRDQGDITADEFEHLKQRALTY